MKRCIIVTALILISARSAMADSMDDAEAKRRGVSVEVVQAEYARDRTVRLENQVAFLEKRVKELESKLSAAQDALKDAESKLQTQAPTTQPEKAATVVAADKPVEKYDTDTGITKANYLRIKNGMSYAEVVKILGSYGEELSSSKIEGVPGVMPSIETKMYRWEVGDTGSSLNIMFQNDKVTIKAQLGLR